MIACSGFNFPPDFKFWACVFDVHRSNNRKKEGSRIYDGLYEVNYSPPVVPQKYTEKISH